MRLDEARRARTRRIDVCLVVVVIEEGLLPSVPALGQVVRIAVGHDASQSCQIPYLERDTTSPDRDSAHGTTRIPGRPVSMSRGRPRRPHARAGRVAGEQGRYPPRGRGSQPPPRPAVRAHPSGSASSRSPGTAACWFRAAATGRSSLYSDDGGANWHSDGPSDTLAAFAVLGTAVPEPPGLTLLMLGGLTLAGWFRLRTSG